MLRSGSGGDPPSKLCGRKTTVGCCRHDNSQSHLEHAAPAQLLVKISLVKWQGGPCFGCYLSSPWESWKTFDDMTSYPVCGCGHCDFVPIWNMTYVIWHCDIYNICVHWDSVTSHDASALRRSFKWLPLSFSPQFMVRLELEFKSMNKWWKKHQFVKSITSLKDKGKLKG